MALPRRGSRTLVVDGHAVRWKYTFRAHAGGDYALVAQLAGPAAGSRLVVPLPWRRPGFWLGGRLKKWPLPTVWAAACIRAALRCGWRPEVRGREVCRTPAELGLDMPLPPVAALARRERRRHP
jgi:hypothetical protein